MSKTTADLNSKINHERDLQTWWRCAFGTIVGVLVAVGFAFAAQQHFNAVEASARNVELQRERHRLKAEQKRLILEREAASSPAQLEKMARNIGLDNLTVRQINHFAHAAAADAEEFETETVSVKRAPVTADAQKATGKISKD